MELEEIGNKIALLISQKSDYFAYQAYLEKMNDMYKSSDPITKEQWDVLVECKGKKKMLYSHELKEWANLYLKKRKKQ